MSWRPSAPGSQLRKWSNDRFSIMSTTTCSTPFEPCGNCAGEALAAVWDRNSEPVITTGGCAHELEKCSTCSIA